METLESDDAVAQAQARTRASNAHSASSRIHTAGQASAETLSLLHGPLSSPMSIVAIKVKDGKTFHVHKDILTKDSAYFERALNGCFTENASQSIDLDDIADEHFGFYIAVQYQLSLAKNGDTVKLTHAEGGYAFKWTSILTLWQLADRFLNMKVLDVAKAAIDYRVAGFGIAEWLRIYNDLEEGKISLKVKNMDQGFKLCTEENIPFTEALVTAFSNCPPQVFAEHIESLSEVYKIAVSKAFALRYADPLVTEKKRRREQEREESAKKQKQ